MRHSSRMASAVAALVLAGCAPKGTLAPFSTDGCSVFPDRALIGRADWCQCCLQHDLAYWRGGTQAERLSADGALRDCVRRATGNAGLALLMFSGVRAGGGPHFYTHYRWGYGWDFGRGYEPLTAAEAAQANRLEAAYRAANPRLVCPGATAPSAAGTGPVPRIAQFCERSTISRL